MTTIDWMGWVLPALKLQSGWSERKGGVASAIPPEAKLELIALHLSKLEAPLPRLALVQATLDRLGPVPQDNVALPKPAMLNYEGGTLADVVAAPLLQALTVNTGTAGQATVNERSSGAALCVLQTGGFDPKVADSEAGRQLLALNGAVGTRTKDIIDLIQAQACTVWPFVLAASGRPFEHRVATRALMDVGLTLLQPLIALTKHHLNVARPQAAGLTTAVAMPGHQSAPSGHAAQAYLMAGLMARLLSDTQARDRVFQAAASVATRREQAGVHFASDSAAGQALGLAVATWLAGVATDRTALAAEYEMTRAGPPTYAVFGPTTAATDELKWLYQQARAEWIISD